MPFAPSRAHPVLILLAPLFLSLGLLGLAWVLAGKAVAVELASLALVITTVAGKFGTLLYDPAGFLCSPWHMAVLIVYCDFLLAFVSIYNFEVLERLPWLGPRIQGVRDFGEEVLSRNPWMRRAAFGGVVAFVSFPLTGTGAIGGAFFGQLVGMRPARTLWAIMTGSILGACLMASVTDWIRHHHPGLAESWAVRAGGVLVLVGAASLLVLAYRRRARRALQPPPS